MRIFCLLLCLCAFNPSDDIAKRDFYLRISKKYCSDAYEIFQSEPDYKKFTQYANGDKESEWLAEFGTVVHETCHGYNSKIGQSKEGYFITSGIKIIVSRKSYYNSTELNNFIPDSVQKNIDRYKVYIDKGMNGDQVASQVFGIYDMLDEFCAYYHGTKAQVELYEYYNALAAIKPSKYWLLYLKHFQSEIYSYYEFKLFMSWYLQYARKVHEDVYNDCMDNIPLRVSYTLLDDEWVALLKDFDTKRNQIIEQLTQKGFKVNIEGQYEKDVDGKVSKHYYFNVIEKNGESNGICTYYQNIEYLTTMLKDTTHRVLNRFRVEGVISLNYKTYLEKK